MPKTKINYSNYIIYVIKCNDDNIKDEYVGSTSNFTKRKAQHKCSCNSISNNRYNNKKYTFIRENGGWENWRMIQLEEYPCDNKREAECREEYWRTQRNTTLNSVKCFRNKEQVQIDKNNWIINNKDYMKNYKKNKIICECGTEIRESNQQRHATSLKHIKLINNI